jgi:hypothetical protein
LQLRTGEQADPTNPGTYIFITTNAARGYNDGVEFSARYLLNQTWQVGGTLGLLRSRVRGMLDDNGNVVPEREQAHAPEYTACVWGLARCLDDGARMLAPRIISTSMLTDHNQQSRAYTIANVKAGYEQPAECPCMGCNLFDKDRDIWLYFPTNRPHGTSCIPAGRSTTGWRNG